MLLPSIFFHGVFDFVLMLFSALKITMIATVAFVILFFVALIMAVRKQRGQVVMVLSAEGDEDLGTESALRLCQRRRGFVPLQQELA